MRDFHVNIYEFHNDSTTISFSGIYEEADGSDRRGKESLKISHGHNKEHRQDLKQLLWMLTVSADHSVPVHYMALNVNTDTQIVMWDSRRRIVGTPDFIYVTDSKLCTRENMNFKKIEYARIIFAKFVDKVLFNVFLIRNKITNWEESLFQVFL